MFVVNIVADLLLLQTLFGIVVISKGKTLCFVAQCANKKNVFNAFAPEDMYRFIKSDYIIFNRIRRSNEKK
jgi:hypothetical protein